MDVNNINPFIESFLKVMPEIGFGEVKKGDLSLKDEELTGSGVIILVGIVGELKGNVAYSIDLESAKQIASKMMMGMPVESLDEMSKSALSEMANMLTANAITIFANNGIEVDISTPTVFEGKDISVKMSSKQVLCVELFGDDIPVSVNLAFE